MSEASERNTLTTRWEAVLDIGNAHDFFSLAGPEIPEIEMTPRFSLTNAYWLSEFCRLVYRHRWWKPTRAEFLDQIGYRETFTDIIDTIRFSIFEPMDGGFSVLVFRGTARLKHWLINLAMLPQKWQWEGSYVHSGFAKTVEKVRESVDDVLDQIDVPMFYAGHSLGAALATLFASYRPPEALYTFGSPRVGNTIFAQRLDAITQAYRFVNHSDVVVSVPFSELYPLNYKHTEKLKYLTADGQLIDESVPESELVNQSILNLLDSFDEAKGHSPECISDHAPYNYSLKIARLLQKVS